MIEPDIPVIDAHTHVHATRAAAHAFMGLLNPALTTTGRDGSVDEASGLMERLSIQTILILPWMFAQRIYERDLQAAGKPANVADEALKDRIAADWMAYNAWAITTAKQHPDRFAATCAIDPVLLGEQRTRAQIDRGLALGAIGLKIVPGFMNAYPFDPRMEIVWRVADQRGLTVTAMCAGESPAAFSHPANFEEVARSYPNMRVVLAHMGLRGGEEVVVRLADKYPNVYGETSSWLGHVGKPGQRTAAEAVDLFRRIGTDRILYGSNYPLTDAAEYAQILRDLPLTTREKHQIFHENAERVYPGIGARVP
jgi:predicted TIM-barrel fold metal-dependent hydrolase